MARKRVVSSTISEYVVPCKFFDLSSEKLVPVVCTFGADFDPEKAEKLVRDRYNTDTRKLVQCGKYEIETWLYSMPEKDFMLHATKSAYRGENGRTRERKITRTIQFYEIPCKFFDLSSEKLVPIVCTFGADFDPEKAEKLVRDRYNTDTRKLVQCGKYEVKTAFYEMPETLYVALAERVRLVTPEELEARKNKGNVGDEAD